MASRLRLDAVVSAIVPVHPHEIPVLLHSSSCFFFILSAYVVVLPLCDEGAISLGLSKLPGLFVGSLMLTLIAAPVSTLVFSLPNLSKSKALVLIRRFFSLSLVLFFILWRFSTEHLLSIPKDAVASASEMKEDLKTGIDGTSPADGWENHGESVLIRYIINAEESFAISEGATLGQLFGSVFAAVTAWFGPFLLLFDALLMEFAAQSSKGITIDITHFPEELSPLRSSMG